MARPEWIEVGRISRVHGLHGEVRVALDSDNPERFIPGSVVYARAQRPGIAGPRLRERVRLTVESVRGDGSFPIVAFGEVASRGVADGLRGHVLEVPVSDLPPLDEDEFYPFDLEGLEVRDTHGKVVGRVTGVVESPAHAILVVAMAAGGDLMVPFVHAAVPEVAVAEGFLTVEPGFLQEGEDAARPGATREDADHESAALDGSADGDVSR